MHIYIFLQDDCAKFYLCTILTLEFEFTKKVEGQTFIKNCDKFDESKNR